MKLQINQLETQRAVADWLAKNHGITVDPLDLEPMNETEGQFEDAVTYQVGWTYDMSKLKEES